MAIFMITTENKEFLKDKILRVAIFEAIFASLMFGLGEKYVSAFAVFLKATPMQIALLSSLSFLLGGFANIISLFFLNKIKNKVRLTVIGSIIQSILWIMIFIIPIITNNLNLLILLYSLYYGVGFIMGNFWVIIIGDMVPKLKSGKYLGFRNSIYEIFLLSSSFLGAFILKKYELLGFAIIFFLASFGRAMSSFFLSKHPEPTHDANIKINIRKLFSDDNFILILLFQGLLFFAVYISSPFFVPYSLNQLNHDYVHFAILFNIASISTILFLPIIGKISDKYGDKVLFIFSVFTMSIFVFCWTITTNFYLLCIFEIFNGIAWACMNLSMMNFVILNYSNEYKGKIYAYISLVKSIFAFLGATFGGYLYSYFPKEYAFYNLLYLSVIFRLISVLSVLLIKEKRTISKVNKLYLVENIRRFNGLAYKVINKPKELSKKLNGFKQKSQVVIKDIFFYKILKKGNNEKVK